MANFESGDDRLARLDYSVIVPLYNEEPVLPTLYKRLTAVMRRLGGSYELIFVNDGSRDGTARLVEELAHNDEHVLFIDLRRNFGQTTALQAGIDNCCGEIIITLDGDLQHDPHEIPLFLQELAKGYDIVSGWRVRRRDNLVMRRIPSRAANWLLAKISGVPLHDFGTTFKAYRREVIDGVQLYGDMHRFVPAVCARLGARISEIPIKNIPRPSGKSNYGIGRVLRVSLDLIMLRFVTGYITRPMHFFGKWGLVSMTGGLGILGFGLVRKLLAWRSFHLFEQHGPLMAVGFLLVLSAMWMLSLGLIGEMLTRVYFESSKARTYAVARRISGRGARAGIQHAQPAPASSKPYHPVGAALQVPKSVQEAEPC